MKKKYPRDLVGYGSKKVKVKWPRNAKLALQFVLNYEEGAESNVLHGDKYSEIFLSEIIGAKPIKDRNLNMESIYEYGSRRGFWRIHDLFTRKKIPLTIFGVGMALERNKEVCKAIKKAKYEIASHGWRWIDYQNVSKAKEKNDMKLAIKSIKKNFGSTPEGWYTGRCSANTLDLVIENGDFLYCSDTYSDDLPYWIKKGVKKQLMIPYNA